MKKRWRKKSLVYFTKSTFRKWSVIYLRRVRKKKKEKKEKRKKEKGGKSKTIHGPRSG